MDSVNLSTDKTVLESLTCEYTFLSDWQLRVDRRFYAGQDRLSNAFLIRANGSKASVPQFVAKYGPSEVRNSKGLLSEWHGLSLAHQGSVPTCALLAPKTLPTNWLMTEFLTGPDGQSAIDSGEEANAIFGMIGTTLWQLHAVPTLGMGDFANPGGNWSETTAKRATSKLEVLGDVLGSEMHGLVKARLAESLPALSLETDEARLIHRDIYLSNFVIDPQKRTASIIDFGMACGGRPLYDLAKFFILDLYRYPEARESFMSCYFEQESPSTSFELLMRLYLYVELLGMIRFFDAVGQTVALDHAKKVLAELVDGHGRIVDLISQ